MVKRGVCEPVPMAKLTAAAVGTTMAQRVVFGVALPNTIHRATPQLHHVNAQAS
jgi:hypothetical protein